MRQSPQSYKAELVGVFGYPVAENPTVVMREAAFQDRDLNWRYLTIQVCPEDLGNAMAGLRAFNMRGVNLTIPHKVAVLQYLDRLSPEAQLIGAVNTVVREGDQLDLTPATFICYNSHDQGNKGPFSPLCSTQRLVHKSSLKCDPLFSPRMYNDCVLAWY